VSAVVQTVVLARRNLLHVLTDPQQLVGMTVQPLMFLLLFVYVFGGAIAGSAGGYLQFVLPGLLVQGVAFGTAQTAVGLNADFRTGLIDRFRSLPIARSAVVAGRVTADLVRTGWAVVINVGAGLALGFRFHGGALGAAAAVGVVLAFGFGLGWLMACLGVWLRSPESVQTAGFLVVLPLTFASSVLVPAASMPGWLQAFVTVNPVTPVTDTVRGLMLGGPVGRPAAAAAAWLAGLTLVFGVATVRGYSRRGR
jgi:ABC transporter DrrB family efflux protein